MVIPIVILLLVPLLVYLTYGIIITNPLFLQFGYPLLLVKTLNQQHKKTTRKWWEFVELTLVDMPWGVWYRMRKILSWRIFWKMYSIEPGWIKKTKFRHWGERRRGWRRRERTANTLSENPSLCKSKWGFSFYFIHKKLCMQTGQIGKLSCFNLQQHKLAMLSAIFPIKLITRQRTSPMSSVLDQNG